MCFLVSCTEPVLAVNLNFLSLNCSLIISTYNWPGALLLCLRSVRNQKVLPGEVIIADDGSAQETANLIEEMRAGFPVPLHHVWHPDEGFKLAAIRNKAIAKAKGEYIIQTDGDLILHPYFIADHLQMRKPGYFVTGSRVMLSAKSTSQLIENRSINLKKYGKDRSNLVNGIRNKFLRNMLATRYKVKSGYEYYVKGCNMAFWRNDLVMVNGYNEAFTGWGREDSELAIRLINAGLKKQFIKMGGICYHLFHRLASRELEPKNVAIMEDAIRHKHIKAGNGLSQYFDYSDKSV